MYAPVAVITAGVDALVNRDREVEPFFDKHAYGINSVKQKLVTNYDILIKTLTIKPL